jgi:hypothetical protein
MAMVQRKFYFPEEMYRGLQRIARTTKKPVTQVLRDFVANGLKKEKTKKRIGLASALLDLAREAKKNGWGKNLPKDFSINHDKYFVEAWEENYRRKQKNR